MRQIGGGGGYETRSYFKKFDGKRVGLAIRAPNVDLAREPRWGRTEESYGEDPTSWARCRSVTSKGCKATIRGTYSRRRP